MASRYPIPSLPDGGLHCTEQLIRRSRFIASSAHAPDAASARAIIEQIRRSYPDATHNCWAFAAGPPGCTAHIGFSDDGEPHGTAGRPILAVLLHGNIGEIVTVVTRYFGGIKLGTGGLVRAYQSVVLENLETLPRCQRTVPVYIDVVIEYSHIDRLYRLLPLFEAHTVSENFSADASFRIALPEEHAAAFRAKLTTQTDGAVLISSVARDQT